MRVVTLTWNYPNSLGRELRLTGGGLTEKKGRAFVRRRAGELGIAVDVSHGSDELFFRRGGSREKNLFLRATPIPAPCTHRRNLTDEQFRTLVKAGGVAGINLYAEFLTDGPCRIADAVRHIEHFLSLGGERNVCLGGDLDGCRDLPEGIGGVQDVRKLAEELARLGYSDALIHDFYE